MLYILAHITLAVCFRRTTGMNFTRYLTQVRWYGERIAKGGLTVKEVAINVGYMTLVTNSV